MNRVRLSVAKTMQDHFGDVAIGNGRRGLLKGNQTYISVEEQEILTLRDILPMPGAPGLRVLFVAKTPAPTSVEAGHYFQGQHGTNFWNRLRTYGLLNDRVRR
jgi:uracil-DNA glycosylase